MCRSKAESPPDGRRCPSSSSRSRSKTAATATQTGTEKPRQRPPDPHTASTTDEAVSRAVTELGTPGTYVPLAAVRARLKHLSRAELDSALERMAMSRRIRLMAALHRMSLSAEDHAAAINWGDEPRHLIRVYT